MNLLCPNCQKMLTVPEQYAGQLMKCPLCAGTFTVPSLPPSMPPAAPPPPPPETYGLSKEPVPPAPPSFAPPPNGATAPKEKEPFAPPSPPPPPGDYTRTRTIWFSPRVLQFVPAVALVLVFFLQLFPWVGVYPGGYAAATQNAWGILVASDKDDPNMKKAFHFTTPEELKANEGKEDKDKVRDNRPDFGWLMLLYLLAFFPTLAITIAGAALGLVPVKLPPAVQPILPWRWGLVAAANLFLCLFVFLLLVLSFPLEKSMRYWAEGEAAKVEPATKRNTVEETNYNIVIGRVMSEVNRTYWFYLACALQFVALFGAVVMFWLTQRERFNKPLPRLDLRL